jgi:hypothetical protein
MLLMTQVSVGGFVVMDFTGNKLLSLWVVDFQQMVYILLQGTCNDCKQVYSSINMTYGSNLKGVDLGNYRILFQNQF